MHVLLSVSALCPASNLRGQVSCGSNTLTLTWDQTLQQGGRYVLRTERVGSGTPPSLYNTTNTSHVLSSLPCGEKYAFSIAAQDNICLSSFSQPVEMSTGGFSPNRAAERERGKGLLCNKVRLASFTVPCPPANLSVHVDCGTNKANFTWRETPAAGFYTVEVTGAENQVVRCTSNDTSCAVKLHCGHKYAAKLVASTESCNSTSQDAIHFDSGEKRAA